MSNKIATSSLTDLLTPYAAVAQECLRRWLVEDGVPPELAGAMEYCVLGGGKRLRPALVLLAVEAVGAEINEPAQRAAAAIEMVHCYSLVHDDLPAMDNDTLRRGLPTAHVKFGQAMAILAGDALLTRAFGLLAGCGSLSGSLVGELAQAAGPAGMIAGQVADMDLCALPAGIEGLRYIHLCKTGAMIRAAVRMGALCGRATASQMDAITRFGHNLGLAFQMIDDLLDVTGAADQIGKTPGKDVQTGKRTYVSVLGIDGTLQAARDATSQAIDALHNMPGQPQALERLAQLLAERTY